MGSSNGTPESSPSSRPLKILHVVFSLDPGGMENGLANLAQRLPADGYDIRVCCLEREGAFAQRFPDPSKIYTLNKTSGFSPRSLLRLIGMIRRLRPDVIHSHNLGTLIYASLATGHGRWTPILHGEHGQLTGEHSEPRRVRQRMKYFRHCRKIHTVSQSLSDHFGDFGFKADQFEVLVNGVDTEHFKPEDKPAARSRFNLLENSLTVGILGRFGPFKRHDVLIEAFGRIDTSAQLLVVGGGGPEEERIRRLAAKSPAADRIHFTGFMRDPRTAYHAMDLLVIPSVNEGLSNALLEAMASGVPALCNAEACGTQEVITHDANGLIADISAPDDLARELTAALVDPTHLIDMGTAARKTAVERFSIETMVSEYERVYRETAESR